MGSPARPDFGELIAAVARELASRDLPYILIGGQAVLLHGEPRLTRHIDITLGAGPDRLAGILEVCSVLQLQPIPEDVEAFVRRTFVLPAFDPDSGIRVDFIFSTTPYEREAIARAVGVQLAGTSVAFASAEDLILHKLFAGRPRDLEDVRGVIRRKGPDLDWNYLDRWAAEFATLPEHETMPEMMRSFRAETGES